MQLEWQGDGRYSDAERQPKEIDMIYAVNKRTKEHVNPDRNRYYPDYLWDYLDADPDGWIEFPGGECPLPSDQRCEVKLGYAKKISQEGSMPASRWHWARGSLSRAADIFAYRPILEAQAKQTKECGVGDHVVFPTGRGVIRLAPDVNNVVIVEDYSDGYKRVALSACELIRTDREKWIEAAIDAHANADYPSNEFEAIYDALKSGELPQP